MATKPDRILHMDGKTEESTTDPIRMKLQRLLCLPVALALAAGLAGCNPFAVHYTSYPKSVSLAAGMGGFAPSSGFPQIVLVDSVHSEIPVWRAKGYVVIGHSAFDSDLPPESSALGAEAKAVGADVVLYKTRFVRQGGTTVSIQEPIGVPQHEPTGSRFAPWMTGDSGPSSEVTESWDVFRYVAVYLRKLAAAPATTPNRAP